MPEDSDQIAKVILISKDSKTLLLLRGMTGADPFTLDIPGGHALEGEEIVDGAIREVKEETNLTVKAQDLTELTKMGRTTYYTTTSWEGTIFDDEELSEHELSMWVSMSSIKHLKGVIIPQEHYNILLGLTTQEQ